jgi:hypothetical protein
MASCRRRHEDHAGTASELMACGLDAFAWTMLGQSVRVLLSLSLGRPKAPSRHLPACPIFSQFRRRQLPAPSILRSGGYGC